MIPKSQIDETIRRFGERTPERQENEAKLSTGSPLTANDPARVQQRINRIMAVEGARLAFAPVEAAVGAPPTVNVLERVLGTNDLISVTFLESAVRAAKTVDWDSLWSTDCWLVTDFPGALPECRNAERPRTPRDRPQH